MTNREPQTLEPAELLTLGLLGLLAALHLTSWPSTGLETLLAGHGRRLLLLPEVTTLLLALPGHLADPAVAYTSAARPLLPSPARLWLSLLLATALVTAATIAAVATATRVAGSTRSASTGRRRLDAQGLASRAEVRQHLSDRTVRRRAGQTRPSRAGQRRYPTSQVGLALGHDLRNGHGVWGSVEDSFLVLGPPRSGKGVRLVVPHTLAPVAKVLRSTGVGTSAT